MTREHHPLQGQKFDVTQEEGIHVSIRLQDGTAMRIPRDWTDADGAACDSLSSLKTHFTPATPLKE